MCGRTACSLSPPALCSACEFKSHTGKICQPEWIDSPDGMNYKQSYNIAPSTYNPVLIAGQLLGHDTERIIQPMRWGFIPSYFLEDPKLFTYSTSNARFEGILNKPIYANSLKKGYRCAVLIEGFYEWEKDVRTGKKLPYFITQKDKKPVMMLAGLFDIVSYKGCKAPLLSYTIITKESIGALSRIHNRMPAILSSEEEVNYWLNSFDIPSSKALLFLRSHEDIQMYRVSTIVNSSKNDNKQCFAPLTNNSSTNVLESWLKRSHNDGQSSLKLEKNNDDDDDDYDIPDKKPKC